ncbi:MAG: prolipoprotein diacylglyceryl transferase family protein [Gemmatimonadota bacterium]
MAVWRGGLSYHGGLTGVLLATLRFCRRHTVSFYSIADRAVIRQHGFCGMGRDHRNDRAFSFRRALASFACGPKRLSANR